MSRIALYPFEDLLDRQPRSFECLRKIAGIKEQSTGHVLLFIFSPRCLEDLDYFCVSFCIFAFDANKLGLTAKKINDVMR